MVSTASCGPSGPAFAWMVPGELALFCLDERERTKEWAAGPTLLLGNGSPPVG